MSIDIKLIDVPKELIPEILSENWQVHFKIRLLEINNRSRVLKDLSELKRKKYADYMKLLNNIKLQLQTPQIINNKRKVERGKKNNQKNIIEIKATGGHSRLFAFLSESKEIIICTHTYWKTSSNKKQQNREFDKAVAMREMYIKYNKGEKNE
jgi:hypothetical protein